MRFAHGKVVALLCGVVTLCFAAAAYALHFELSRFLFPRTPDLAGRAAEASFSIKSRSGNELLVRRYGHAKVGCVLFFPGQHGATASYNFDTYVAAGLAVYALAYPGQDGALGRTELSEIEGLVDRAAVIVASACQADRTVFVGVSLGAMLAAYANHSTVPAGLVLSSAAPSLSSAIRTRLRSNWMSAPLSLLPLSRLLARDYSLGESLQRPSSVRVVIFQGTSDVRTPMELLDRSDISVTGARVVGIPGGTHSTTFALSRKARTATILQMLRSGSTR